MAERITRKIQCNKNNQWTITVPKTIVGILKIEEGDMMEFTIVGDTFDAEIHMKRYVK